MDTVEPARFIFASSLVLGLLGLFAVMLKFYIKSPFMGKVFLGSSTKSSDKNNIISVEEISYIDPKTKLLLIRRDDVGHLLMISDSKVTVIESNIKMDKKSEPVIEDEKIS
ncbi:MAG: hypothetical protein R3D71_07795 [Rickettsiales bacterium]